MDFISNGTGTETIYMEFYNKAKNDLYMGCVKMEPIKPTNGLRGHLWNFGRWIDLWHTFLLRINEMHHSIGQILCVSASKCVVLSNYAKPMVKSYSPHQITPFCTYSQK